MNPLKKITHELKEKIQLYIKNGKDISDLIVGYSLKGEDLSNSIIKKLNRYNEDLSNCNFAYSTVGELGRETNLSGCKLRNCNFYKAIMLGKTVIRNADMRNSCLKHADFNHFEYAGTDFRGVQACGMITKIGTETSKGSIWDEDILDVLKTGWILVPRGGKDNDKYGTA